MKFLGKNSSFDFYAIKCIQKNVTEDLNSRCTSGRYSYNLPWGRYFSWLLVKQRGAWRWRPVRKSCICFQNCNYNIEHLKQILTIIIIIIVTIITRIIIIVVVVVVVIIVLVVVVVKIINKVA